MGFKNPKLVFSAAFAACLCFCFGSSAKADMTMTITQQGANVVGTGSGTLNLAALTEGQETTGGGLAIGTFELGGSAIGLGPFPVAVESFTGTVTGSSSTFGSGTEVDASSGTGDAVDISPGSSFAQIFVPLGYVFGDPLSDTSIWENTTIADLGLTPGTYTYNWGSGATADSFTVIIGQPPNVPEPSSFILLGSGLLGLAGAVKRRFQ